MQPSEDPETLQFPCVRKRQTPGRRGRPPKRLQLPLPRIKEILQTLMSSPSAQYFTSAPAPSDFPDYREKVDHLDLAMILQRLKAGAYRNNTGKFESEVRRVWANAMAYFPQSHARYQLAEANSRHFEEILAQAYRAKDPLKAMEERVVALEQQLKEVIARLARNEKRRSKPPTPEELSKLSLAIQSLPEQYRRGLIDVAPRHFAASSEATCTVDLKELSRSEYAELRRYIRSCREDSKPRKRQKVAETPQDDNAGDCFDRDVRRGQAELMQARGDLLEDSSSSDDSEEDSTVVENGVEDRDI